MSDRPNFPDFLAWQKLRDELEPFQTNNQINNKIVSYIDRIIQCYDDPIARQTPFEELIDLLKVTTDLLNKISLALTPDPTSTSSPEQLAREILLQWLPDRLVAFSILEVDYEKVIRGDGSVTYKQAGLYMRRRLKEWLFFPALAEWQKLQSRINPYRIKTINIFDKFIIESIDKAEKNYLPIQPFIICIEDIGTLMMSQERIQNILTGTSANRSQDNALRTSWAEARLKSWLIRNLIKFKPTGKNVNQSLTNYISNYLHYRISSGEFENYMRYRSNGPDRSLSESLGDDFTLSDKIAAPSDPEQDIADLQEAEKARRGLPILVEFLKGVVDSLEATYQNSWEVRLANYVNQDSKFKLRSIFHVDRACNYQYLLQSLILPKFQGLPPKTIADICREFPAIGKDGLYDHIKNIFHPWVDSIYLEILTAEEWTEYRNYLENVAIEDLTTKYRRRFPTCNIFFLAQHRLPCFTAHPLDWTALAELISTQDGRRITPEYVKTYWQEECVLTLGKHARIEIFEYKTA
jgi:hypothetical protein